MRPDPSVPGLKLAMNCVLLLCNQSLSPGVFYGDPNCNGSHRPLPPDDIEALTESERRFRKLTSEGFTAAVRTAAGESWRVFAFDPTAKETLFFRRLVGG